MADIPLVEPFDDDELVAATRFVDWDIVTIDITDKPLSPTPTPTSEDKKKEEK